MNIDIKETDYCKLEVHYEADQEQIEKKKNEVLLLFKNAPCKGFRQGKANIEVIKIQYRQQINDATKRALAEEAFHNTLFEKNIKPFGTPEFKSMILLNNKFSCEFSMHKKPDFELAPYKDFEIPKQEVGYSTTELYQRMIQELRVRFGESVPFAEGEFVQKDDNIIIDYKAFDGDKELDNLAATGELMTVGKGKLPEFDDNLLGMKLGETREFTLKIPETGLPSVIGKEIKFIVSLMLGTKIHPMPIGDELAVKFGKENLLQLEAFLNERAVGQWAEAHRGLHINQISSRLIADHDFEIPYWLTLSEAQYLAANSKLEWENLLDEDKVKFLSVAEGNVKLALILDKIREVEPETQVSDQEAIEMIRGTLEKSIPNIDDAFKQMSQSGYLNILVARIRDEQVLDFILKNSKIIE